MKTLILCLVFNILVVVQSLDPPTENKETRTTAKEQILLSNTLTITDSFHLKSDLGPEIYFYDEKESFYLFFRSVTALWSLHQSRLQFRGERERGDFICIEPT